MKYNHSTMIDSKLLIQTMNCKIPIRYDIEKLA